MDTKLKALMINCTLKPSPEPSSCDVLGGQVLAALEGKGVTTTSVRAVDYTLLPGVESDMGDADEWPTIRRAILDVDVLVFVTPTWLGQHSSVAQRVLERLNADSSEKGPDGTPVLFNKVAIPVVVGNEDGAHHICGILTQSLSDVGFTIPAQPSVYWNGEALHKTDYRELDSTPDAVASAVSTASSNAVHLARLLRNEPYSA